MVSFLAHNRQGTIAVIVGFLMLLLALCAVVLVLPASTTAQCVTQLTVQRVFTQDAAGTEQTTFAPGETIRFVAELNNAYGGWMLGADGAQLFIGTSFYTTTNPVDFPPGSSTWTWEAPAPSTAGDYAVAVRAYDSFCGMWVGGIGENGSFSVTGPEETPPPEAEPTITLDPTEGPPGTEVTVTGSGWAPGDTVSLQFAANLENGDYHFLTDYYALGETAVGDDGGFTFTFLVPADAKIGDARVAATSADSSWIIDPLFQVTEPGEGETDLVANAGPDQTVSGPSPVAVQFDGSGSTGDIVSYHWYNQYGLLRAEGATPVIDVNFGYDDPQPGTQRMFTLVVEDSQGNTAQDEVTITLGEIVDSSLVANAGADQTVSGSSPVAVQFDGSGSTGDIVSYHWYNQWGLLRAEGVAPVIDVNFGYTDPQPGTVRTFTLVVEDSQGNTAQDEVIITLGETADTEPPTVSWEKPVGNDVVYPTTSGTVELEVAASDSSGIARVEMWLFAATGGEGTLIAEFTSPPYRTSLDINTLPVGQNEISADVVDNAGNLGYASIWVERLEEGQPPAAPSNLKAEPISQQGKPGTQLSWTDTADNEDGFRVVDQNRPQEYEAGAAPGTGSTVSITLPFASGCFRVYAYNRFGRSPLSEMVCTQEPGRLRVIKALEMSGTNPLVWESVTASFTVKNEGGSALHLEELAAGARRGRDWNGAQADFPRVSNITLQPNEEYVYNQSRSFDI
jgi:hypothetical protein